MLTARHARLAALIAVSCLAASVAPGVPAAHGAQRATEPQLAAGTLGAYGPTYADTPRAVALSKQLGITLPENVPTITLEAISNDALIAEDGPWNPANNPEGLRKPLRYGVGRDVTLPADTGVWMDGPDGTSVWVIDIRSPGAVGIRVHLADVNMPEGAQVVAYSPDTPSLAEGPYFGRGVLDTGEVWVPTTFSDTCRVELQLPKGAPRQLPFRIDSIQHIYRNLWQVMDPAAEVGTCHNDVTCFSAWANTAKACAGIGSISGGVSLYCSGTMLNTTAADQTPYWLTANHCLSTAAAASTAEIYWLYQTGTCNGTVPALGSVARSSVATLVNASASTDHSLLLIRGALPAGLFFAGWSSSRPAASAALTSVHHPDGSWKRYSTGTYAGTGTYSGASSIRSNWNSGVTEPGSSGGGLFLTSTQQLVGQLFGGPSACGLSPSSLYDWYGDFSLTYSNFATVSSALAAGSDDTSEPNNSCATARAITGTTGSLTARIVKSTSEDWYSISVPAGGTAAISLANITNAYGNVDLQLYTVCAGSPAASSTTTGATETVSYTNIAGSAVTVYARVFLASSVRNSYDLSWSLTSAPVAPANNACSAATVITTAGGTFTGSTANATSDGSATCGGTPAGPDVWYAFTAPAAGTLVLNTCGSTLDTVLSISSACGGTQLACNDDAAPGVGPCGGGNTSYLSQTLTSGQSIRIRVGGWNGASGAFSLAATWTASATGPANDRCSGATAIFNGATAFNTSTATTDGPTDTLCLAAAPNAIDKDIWFAYTPTCTGTVTVNTCGTTGFDSVVGIYSGCPTANNQALACNDDFACTTGGNLRSQVTFNSVAGRNYLIRVGGYNGASGAGTLSISCTVPPPPPPTPCSVADIVDSGGTAPGDGTLDGSDFIAFINSFSIGDATVDSLADLNFDGTIDGTDFIDFINAFGLGC